MTLPTRLRCRCVRTPTTRATLDFDLPEAEDEEIRTTGQDGVLANSACRFSRNAANPSCASGMSAAAAMTSTASA